MVAPSPLSVTGPVGLFAAFAGAGAAIIVLRRGTRWRTMMVSGLLVLTVVEGIRRISPAWSGSPGRLAVDLAGLGFGGAAGVAWRRIRPRVARDVPVRVL